MIEMRKGMMRVEQEKMNYDDLGWMGARRNTTVIKELAAYRENERHWTLFIPRSPSSR